MSSSWDVEKITNDIKSMKIKAKSRKFKDAFETAQKSVDERHGLVVITGSPSLITEYWSIKVLKKFKIIYMIYKKPLYPLRKKRLCFLIGSLWCL